MSSRNAKSNRNKSSRSLVKNEEPKVRINGSNPRMGTITKVYPPE